MKNIKNMYRKLTMMVVLGILLAVMSCNNLLTPPKGNSTDRDSGSGNVSEGGKVLITLKLFTGSARMVMPDIEQLDWHITAEQGTDNIEATGTYPTYTLELPTTGPWTFTVKGTKENKELFTGTVTENVSNSTTSISIPLSPGSGMTDSGATGKLNLTIKPEKVLTMTLSYRVDGGNWYNCTTSSGWDPDQGSYWIPYSISGTYPVGQHTLDLYFGEGSKFYFCTVAVNIWPGMTSDRWIKTNGEEYINDSGEFVITEEMVNEFVKTMGSVVFVDASVDANTPATGSIFAPVKTVSTAVDILRKANEGNTQIDGTIMVSGATTITNEVQVQSGETLTVKGTGTGASITNDKGRVFNIASGGSLTLGENITLTGTNDTGNGGAVYVNCGTFTMKADSKITGSSASYGGGVYVDSKGTFTMGGGTISKNSASGGGASGGGASGGGVCISGGTFTMSGGAVISGNTATSSGGGVFVSESGKFTMEGGTIGGTGGGSPNSAENGGGVYIFEGTFTMSDSAVISGNNASSSSGSSSSGGGVYIHNGTFTMSGGAVISGNSASSSSGSSSGGGVYVYETGKFTMEGGTIGGSDGASANSSESGGGVCVYKGTFTMNGGSIQGNKSNGSGGGIYLDSTGGTVTLNNTSSISGNQAVQNGGGVNIGSNGVFTMSNGTISGNTATQKGGGVYVSSTGNFTLGSSSAVSSPVISGNTKTGNSPNNVYLDDTFLSIDGELKKSKEPGNIGISMDTPGEEFTLGWGSSGLTDTTFFFSDDTERNVALSGSELSLNLVRVEGGSCTLNGQNVTLSSFWISPYEVTQAEFKSIMTGNTNGIASNPSYFPDNPAAGEVQERRPVDTVRWYEAIVYCNLLSIKEGLTPCYTIKGFTDPADWGVRPDSQIHDNYYYWNSVTCDFDANGYRLPTEAEWEYAARGGKPGMTDSSWNNIYSGSTTPDDVAWYTGNSDSKTHEVGKKQANALGLYDMSGNLKEWCWNRESEGNDSRVMGGGYYSSAEGGCQVTAFDSNFPISQSPDQGFRVVRSIR